MCMYIHIYACQGLILCSGVNRRRVLSRASAGEGCQRLDPTEYSTHLEIMLFHEAIDEQSAHMIGCSILIHERTGIHARMSCSGTNG